MSAVWQLSEYSKEKLLVLLALADWANDDGVCWPSMLLIAEKARITERGAKGIMHQLISDGVVEVLDAGGGRGNVPRYRVLPPVKGEPASPFMPNEPATSQAVKGEPASPFMASERVNVEAQRVNVEAVKGEPDDIAIRKNRQEPPINQPPLSTAGAALKAWLSIKGELQKQLPDPEWRLWVRPAYLLKVLSGGTLLVTLPPNNRIFEAARARLPSLRALAAHRGYEGVVFGPYPDEYERSQIQKLHPEFYEQMLGNRTTEARCAQPQ